MTKEEYLAIKNRDSSCDGLFYYGLKTTKHICRPSCGSALGKPENIIIFHTLDEGIAMGYTPCPHCRPDIDDWKGSSNELAESAKEYMRTHYDTHFSTKKMAEDLFVSESYLCRTFKKQTGTTLLAYQNMIRMEIAKELLTHNELSISYICNAAGYVSASHFSRIFKKMFSCTPLQWRKQYNRKLEQDSADG